MASDNNVQETSSKMVREYDLSIEVVILIVFGVFMLIFGFLLFKIHTGALPYNPDSTYGLFLVIVSIQIITMGKTPFGDLRRSWALIVVGICTAILGMAACFIQGFLSEPVRLLVGVILLIGGIALLLQLFSKEKGKAWIKVPGILRHLTVACALVYVITIILGLVTLLPSITTDFLTASILIIYGVSFFYLSLCIHKVRGAYPEEPDDHATSKPDNSKSGGLSGFFKDASLELSPAILLLVGILLALLGVLLFPVHYGILLFSPDGQLGVLLFITALQMVALGSTPIGQYKRSWPVITIGIIFVALAIVSCIVPGLLTDVLTKLLGVMNILGGAILLVTQLLPKLFEMRNLPPIERKLLFNLIAVNVVAVVFGSTMLLPQLIPPLVTNGILIFYGIIIFLLVFLLQRMSAIGTGT